ncbi:hypothetical protein ANRL2_01666 [Anaerolineae bacterium]|nr:hypothetical protein ANRL2_01666 [Anaerolineae bacterium]
MSDTPPPGPAPTPRRAGWFKASRGDDPLALIHRYPMAYVLAAVIAHRARWNDSAFNPHALKPGECLLGDHESYGMSQREYRTSKATLQQGGFATFQATNAGTIARLCDARLFDVSPTPGDNPADKQATTQPTTQATTNQEQRLKNEEERTANSERQPEFDPLTPPSGSQTSGPVGPGCGPDSQAKASKPKREPKPEELLARQEFRLAWEKAFKEALGFDYRFNGAKDAEGIKRILASKLSVPELIAIARREWSTPSSTFNRDMAASIAGFASRLNEIRAGQARPAGRNGQPAPAPDHAKGFFGGKP